MIELPLFPLNTVLFPGMPLQLHIFEDRYKQMIGDCVKDRQPFGVVLIRKGREAFGPAAKPYDVGCTAQITQLQQLTMGRMNIVAVGVERFRIAATSSENPYLVGNVTLFPLENEAEAMVTRSQRRLVPLIERYLKIMKTAGKVQHSSGRLPDNPMTLAYLAAVLIQTEPPEKQALLETPHTAELLDKLRTLYRHEVTILSAMLHPPDHEESDSAFSLN